MEARDMETIGNLVKVCFDKTQRQVVDAIVADSEVRYECEVRHDELEMEDGVVLTANRRACLALSRIFGQLALCDLQDGYSVRLGWDETDAVGIRIVLDETGRMDGCSDE